MAFEITIETHLSSGTNYTEKPAYILIFPIHFFLPQMT